MNKLAKSPTIDTTNRAFRLHKEAFCIMQYECPKEHTVYIYNSRDGVTPFIIGCKQIGCDKQAQHVRWNEDKYELLHKLEMGEWFWRDGTPEEAYDIVMNRLNRYPPDEQFLRDNNCRSAIEFAHLLVNNPDGEFRLGWPMLDRWGIE